MKAKINEKIFCIPPFISTSWDQISSLHSEEDPATKRLTLLVHTIDGKVVKIENLEAAIIEVAFTAHLQYLEKAEAKGGVLQSLLSEGQNAIPFKIDLVPGMKGFEGLEMAFQHNPAQAEIPPMPEEMLQKVASIANILTNGELTNFPKPEPHCNCMHCQVARAIHKTAAEGSAIEEPHITAEDLKFRSWDIASTGENLYSVCNPLDTNEKYTVYLGTPVGCTCGTKHCEHIHAVLNS